MAKVVATYKDNKVVLQSVRLITGSVDKVSQNDAWSDLLINWLC